MSFVTVTGWLLASHFQAGGEVPLSGQIFFTPTMGQVPAGEGVHLPAPTSVELDGEGRFEVELLSAGFSWEVGFSLRHAGAFVPVGCFNFLPTPGVDRVNFADIVPAPPVADAWEVGKAYKVGDLVAYNGKTYRIAQAHTSAAHWTPDAVPALYTVVG